MTGREQFEFLLDDYVEGTLSAEDAAAFDALLAANPDWAAEARAERELVSLMHEAGKARAPEGLLVAAMAKAKAAEVVELRPAPMGRGRFRLWQLAAALVVLGGGWVAFQMAGEPRVTEAPPERAAPLILGEAAAPTDVEESFAATSMSADDALNEAAGADVASFGATMADVAPESDSSQPTGVVAGEPAPKATKDMSRSLSLVDPVSSKQEAEPRGEGAEASTPVQGGGGRAPAAERAPASAREQARPDEQRLRDVPSIREMAPPNPVATTAIASPEPPAAQRRDARLAAASGLTLADAEKIVADCGGRKLLDTPFLESALAAAGGGDSRPPRGARNGERHLVAEVDVAAALPSSVRRFELDSGIVNAVITYNASAAGSRDAVGETRRGDVVDELAAAGGRLVGEGAVREAAFDFGARDFRTPPASGEKTWLVFEFATRSAAEAASAAWESGAKGSAALARGASVELVYNVTGRCRVIVALP